MCRLTWRANSKSIKYVSDIIAP